MIEQAVILAGGLGTRMAPFTANRPKPLFPIHGRPFLDWLLDMLRGQGIRRVVLLVGYRADMIRDHVGDGAAYGLEVLYSETPVEDETGARIRKARSLFDDEFLLMYSDNYWPLRLRDLEADYRRKDVLAQMVVYDNADGYTKSNIRTQDGLVAVYDKSRTTDGLQGVDIGFTIVDRRVVDALPDANISFEAFVYPKLVADGRLGAFVSGHRYYSIGSPDRIPETARFLARKPALLLDRDGVLNARMPRGEYVRRWADWRWLSGARAAIAHLTASDWRVILITNQAGIARGLMTEADLAEIHARLRDDVAAAGGRIDAIYHCPHGWDDGCACRKPAPGMLFAAQRDFALDLTRTVFIGDDERDGQAAAAAGCPFILFDGARPLPSIVRALTETGGASHG